MSHLRTLSPRRLSLLALALLGVALAGTGIARAALAGGADPPPPKPLAQALHDAAAAPKVAGVTARVRFANNLLPAGAVPGGESQSSPLLTGATGRVWLRSDGRFRLELQSRAGDSQIVSDGREVRFVDAGSKTIYVGSMPDGEGGKEHGGREAHGGREEHGAPSIKEIERGLARLSRKVNLSGAEPGSVADRPAYTLRVSPKRDGGLLGAGEVAWDATRGVPLRAAVYAQGRPEPVIELAATEIGYDAVAVSDVEVPAPAGFRVVRLADRPKERRSAEDERARGRAKDRSEGVRGVEDVQAALPFRLAAPSNLVGLPRRDVRLIEKPEGRTAVVIYGRGLGAIVVAQSEVRRGKGARPGPFGGPERGQGREGMGEGAPSLPKVSIEGATGTELSTALGTVVSFERDGVSYVVGGSVEPVAAEAAARELR